MTVKQKKLLELLPENNYNLTKSAIKAGYRENYANTKLHSDVRKSKGLKDIFDSDTTKKKIKRAQKKFLKDNDNTNYMRAVELEAKISVPELRKSEITQTNPEKIIISYNKTTSDGKDKPSVEG